MEILTQLAEGRIAEAMARGEFDHLPGRGKPLPRDDDGLVSPDLRMAYRILKNAGVVPREIELRKEIADIETLLQALPPGKAHDQAARRRSFLLTKLGSERGGKLRGAHVMGSRASTQRDKR